MRKQTYINKMTKHELRFNKLWHKIVWDTNEFIKTNPDINMHSLQGTRIENLIDYLIISGAWIEDRFNKKSGVTSSKNYRGSLTKKVRKALGYTF